MRNDVKIGVIVAGILALIFVVYVVVEKVFQDKTEEGPPSSEVADARGAGETNTLRPIRDTTPPGTAGDTAARGTGALDTTGSGGTIVGPGTGDTTGTETAARDTTAVDTAALDTAALDTTGTDRSGTDTSGTGTTARETTSVDTTTRRPPGTDTAARDTTGTGEPGFVRIGFSGQTPPTRTGAPPARDTSAADTTGRDTLASADTSSSGSPHTAVAWWGADSSAADAGTGTGSGTGTGVRDTGTDTTARDTSGVGLGAVGAPPDRPEPGREYRIRSGDTFSGIAKQAYGKASLYKVIQDANPKINPRAMPLGEIIYIPHKPLEPAGGSATRSAEPLMRSQAGKTGIDEATGKRYYVVKAGDTQGLWGIARELYGGGKYYTTLVEANPGVDPKKLREGMKIWAPQEPTARPAGGVSRRTTGPPSERRAARPAPVAGGDTGAPVRSVLPDGRVFD